MKSRILTLVALLAAPLVSAQDGSGFDNMDIIHAEDFTIVGSQARELSGGVSIVLSSSDPTVEAMPIKANTITMEYADESSATPRRIILVGNVDIKHPQARVRAQRAEWDFSTNLLVFTGNPAIESEMAKSFSSEKITINVLTGEVSGSGSVSATGIKFGDAAGASDPSLLSESDITDWNGLLSNLKSQAAASEPSPGKAIVAQLDPSLQGPLQSLPTDQLLGMKPQLVKAINGVLKQPDLYNAEAWAGIALSEGAQALADKGDRSATETTQLNRQLIAAAYPGAVKGL